MFALEVNSLMVCPSSCVSRFGVLYVPFSHHKCSGTGTMTDMSCERRVNHGLMVEFMVLMMASDVV